MKLIFTIFVLLVRDVFGGIHADGAAFFPVVVQVVEKESGLPVARAKVRLDDLPPYQETETVPSRQVKVLSDRLGKEVVTNESGVIVVFYFGRWGSSTTKSTTTYSRSLIGTVVVDVEGKEVFRQSLEKWAQDTKFKAGANDAPWIVVPVDSKKK